jgi:WD40 repeat protein
VKTVGPIINTLDFINAHDRTLICVGTDDSAVRIFDESNHRLLSSWIAIYDEQVPFRQQPMPLSKSSAKFVLDWNQHQCRIYASNTDIDYVCLWDVERERCVSRMGTDSSIGICFLQSDCQGYCAAGMANGTVRCFDARSKEGSVLNIESVASSNEYSPLIALDADSTSRLLSISNNGQLRRWDITQGVSTDIFTPQSVQQVLAADFHATGNVLALATPHALQFKTCFGDLLFDIQNSKFAQVSSLSFHPYRQLLAVGFHDGSLSIFTGKTKSSAG